MAGESSSLVPALVGGAIGFASAVLAEPLRRWLFSPSLALSFGEGPDYRSRTPEQAIVRDDSTSTVTVESNHVAEYVRIKVVNNSRTLAKACRAYLVRVEKKEESGDFRPTFFVDSIPLAWSCREKFAIEPVDIPNGVAQFIDLVSVRSVSSSFKLHVHPLPFRYSGLTMDKGTFRFTVQVAGENSNPKFIQVIFAWNGRWEKYNACVC